MARSINGNFLGRAAVTELRELREHNEEMWLKEQKQKLIDEENALFEIAAELDGFCAFWDAVPDFGSRRERIKMLKDFISSHESREGHEGCENHEKNYQ